MHADQRFWINIWGLATIAAISLAVILSVSYNNHAKIIANSIANSDNDPLRVSCALDYPSDRNNCVALIAKQQ
jgi:hypothetical protein